MKITVEIENNIYEIDTEKDPKALNPKQIEILLNILDIPFDFNKNI